MVTEEELAKMAPEELAEFQKMNCVFCQIAAGRVPARAVYSDAQCMAVLDINPASKGHMLLLPKEHYSVMPQLPPALASHLFMVAKGLSQAALKALQAKGTTIFVANGVAAGQRAPHFMVHVIPRRFDDGVSLEIPVRSFQKKELDAISSVLGKALSQEKAAAAPVKDKEAEDKGGKKAKAVKKLGRADKKGAAKAKVNLDDVARVLG